MEKNKKNYLESEGIITKRLVYTDRVLLDVFEFFYKDFKENKNSKLEITFSYSSRSEDISKIFKISFDKKDELSELTKNIQKYLDTELISNIKIEYCQDCQKIYYDSVYIKIDKECSLYKNSDSEMIIATDNKQWLNHCRSELDKFLCRRLKKIILPL